MEWPAAKFEAMYDAHSRRCAARDTEARRIATVTALMSNSNFDGSQDAINQIEESFDQVINSIYGKKNEDEINFSEDPFFNAMKLPDVPSNYLQEEDDKRFSVRHEVDQS